MSSNINDTAMGRTNWAVPVANMPFGLKLDLVETRAMITIKWIDAKSSKPMTMVNVPMAMFQYFSPLESRFKISHYGTIYDLGVVAGLSLGAVHYVICALISTCRTRSGPNTLLPAAFPDATDVLRQLKCLAAAKKLGMLRCVQYVYFAAAMDAVRAVGKVTAEEFNYFLDAFGNNGAEPMLLRHMFHCIVYAELTDKVESPDTLKINRIVTGIPVLAVMKRVVEVEVQRKLTKSKIMDKREAQEKSRLKHLEWVQRRDAAQQRERERQANRQEKLEKARNGERALTEAEIYAMQAGYVGPRMATVSHKLR